MARPKHQPTEQSRRYVESMSAFGFDQEQIAKVVGVAPQTLRKHYREELDTADIKANAKVADSLFRKALGDGPGAVAAAIFWMKTRCGWKETAALEHTGKDGGPVRFEASGQAVLDALSRKHDAG